MPRIPKPALECVAYLYPSEDDARRGEQAGGTGFVVGVGDRRDGWTGSRLPWSMRFWERGADKPHGEPFLYVVTAAHVINPGRSPVVRLTTDVHGTVLLEMSAESWIRHPDGDDVAVCPLGPAAELPQIPFIPEGAFAMEGAVESEGVGVGDEAFFIGRFVNHDGRQRNAPTARFGNVSMLPGEPVRHTGFQLDQESFLVEMRSLPGYSGSPVFVYSSGISLRETLKGWEARRDAKRAIHPRGYRAPTLDQQVEANYTALFSVHLLGVDWAHLAGTQRVKTEAGDPVPERWHVEENSGMMAVVPAWKVSEILHSDDEVARRSALVPGELGEDKT